MLKRMLRDSLATELQTVEGLLRDAQAHGDFVGEVQFQAKRDELQRELAELPADDDTRASMAILFGGAPVIGSHGMLSEVAGKSLDALQEMVNKKFAYTEFGDLGARGRVAGNRDSRLMVTEVARGSFGFVLEEASDQHDFIRTPLATVVDETADLIAKLGSPDEQAFEAAVADLDDRILSAARKFFHTLDEAGATVRIVEGEHDFILNRHGVELARRRTEEMRIEEHDGVELNGTLIGFLPVHRRFEFQLEGGEVITGPVQRDAARDLQEQLQVGLVASPIGRRWVARFRVRNVTARNAEPRTYHTLLGLVREI